MSYSAAKYIIHRFFSQAILAEIFRIRIQKASFPVKNRIFQYLAVVGKFRMVWIEYFIIAAFRQCTAWFRVAEGKTAGSAVSLGKFYKFRHFHESSSAKQAGTRPSFAHKAAFIRAFCPAP